MSDFANDKYETSPRLSFLRPTQGFCDACEQKKEVVRFGSGSLLGQLCEPCAHMIGKALQDIFSTWQEHDANKGYLRIK